MREGAASAASSPIGQRWALGCAALVAEVVWLTASFQAPDASLYPRWQPLLTVFNEGFHKTAAIIFGATFLLIASADLSRTVRVLANQAGYTWWPWAALHAVALLAFAHLTALGFGVVTGAPDLSLTWLIVWATAGTATFLSWLLILAPATAWLDVLKQQRLNLVLGLAAGTAVWLGGLLVQNLWEPLAGGTLWLSGILLSLIYPRAVVDPSQALVGTDTFMIKIFPVCSGYEGIALVTVFIATYLWLFRAHLSFPRALILFPIGIASIWFANALRITALIIVGNVVSPEVAAKGFHTQAGWIAFTLVTLGLIAISHRWLSAAGRAGARDITAERLPELALLAPLLALMATSMIIAALSAGFAALYPLGVVTTGAVLWHYRTAYRTLFWTLVLGALRHRHPGISDLGTPGSRQRQRRPAARGSVGPMAGMACGRLGPVPCARLGRDGSLSRGACIPWVPDPQARGNGL